MKSLIIANWKMNPQTLEEAKALFNAVKNTKAIICPPFVYLSDLRASGAQDCFYEEKGAYTGEVSPLMLKNVGIKYVIIGHSERRKYFRETNEIIEKKLKAALKMGLKPILCIDKTSQISPDIKRNLIIAYEPLFAIGTGKACSLERAKKMRLAIRKVVGSKTLILYGGSVNSQNARGYLSQAGFQGLLVGGASLKSKEFIDIIKRTCYAE